MPNQGSGSKVVEFAQHFRGKSVLLNLFERKARSQGRPAPKDPGYERVELTIQFGLERVLRRPFGPS